jgi:hypothetical protein
LSDVLRGIARSMLSDCPDGSWSEGDALAHVRAKLPSLTAREARILVVLAAASAQMASELASVYTTHFLAESERHRALAAGSLGRLATWNQGLLPVPPLREDLTSWVGPSIVVPPRDAGTQTTVDAEDIACGSDLPSGAMSPRSALTVASSTPPFQIHVRDEITTSGRSRPEVKPNQERKRKLPIQSRAPLPILSLNVSPPRSMKSVDRYRK